MSTIESPQVRAPRQAPVSDTAVLKMCHNCNRRLSNFRQVFSAQCILLGESISSSVLVCALHCYLLYMSMFIKVNQPARPSCCLCADALPFALLSPKSGDALEC